MIRNNSDIVCNVCNGRKPMYMNKWKYSRKNNWFFCSEECYNVFLINPLPYSHWNPTASYVRLDMIQSAFNIDNETC